MMQQYGHRGKSEVFTNGDEFTQTRIIGNESVKGGTVDRIHTSVIEGGRNRGRKGG